MRRCAFFNINYFSIKLFQQEFKNKLKKLKGNEKQDKKEFTIMNVLKTAKYVFGSFAFIAMSAFMLPKAAFAAQTWGADEIIGGDSVDPTTIDAEVISGWVKTFATWAIGIAIVIFVLRIVITAIDRMLFQKDNGSGNRSQGVNGSGGGGGNSDSPLSGLPSIIRPYTGDWKSIFKTFALQLGVCACAWLIVNILAGVVLWVANSLLSQ